MICSCVRKWKAFLPSRRPRTIQSSSSGTSIKSKDRMQLRIDSKTTLGRFRQSLFESHLRVVKSTTWTWTVDMHLKRRSKKCLWGTLAPLKCGTMELMDAKSGSCQSLSNNPNTSHSILSQKDSLQTVGIKLRWQMRRSCNAARKCNSSKNSKKMPHKRMFRINSKRLLKNSRILCNSSNNNSRLSFKVNSSCSIQACQQLRRVRPKLESMRILAPPWIRCMSWIRADSI